jgi:O-antigen biosynthesis protein
MTRLSETTLIDRESFFWTPDYIVSSAWIEHVPFAFWIIEVAKPKVLVELGVHNGTSYFAFCQAIRNLNINTTCYGVDTWKGDEHVGFYSDEVFNQVSGWNNRHYSKFSTLIRTTFDEAKDSFLDGSIELLHIDGRHTYEAVKHDFETWKPKLAKNAIVLFHDINARVAEFGVFKLWDELKKQYPNFQFDYGYGLGVIAIGEIPQNELSTLFNADQEDALYRFLTNLFFDRGNNFKIEMDYGEALQQEKKALNEERNNISALKETHNADISTLNENHNAEIAALKDNHYTDIAALEEKYNTDITALNKNHYAELAALEENYNTALLAADDELLEMDKKSNDRLSEVYNQLNNANTHINDITGELTRIKKENEQLLIYLNWYRTTYENRSLAGVLKEKLKGGFKRFYINFINYLLEREKIKNKYAITYSLEYIRDNGIKYSLGRAFSMVRKNGLKSISKESLRKKAVKKIKNKSHRLLPVVEQINVDLIKQSIATFDYCPKISIIFPTYNTKPELLALAIKSVHDQLYTNWELCIVDDCSTNNKTIEFLKTYQEEPNTKIRFLNKNVGISEASNAAIAMTTGDFIALMDHDDEITIDALYHVVKLLNEHQDADIIYSDECKVDEQGVLSDYFFKPQWSPELLINLMYMGHLTVYRKAFLLDDVGLFRKEYDFSQDYDLALRATEKTSNIYHIDKVIYHWRITEGSSSQGDKPYARTSNLAALQDAARRRNINCTVVELPVANRLKIKIPSGRKASIIVPTDSFDNLKETIESILYNTSYTNYEILAVTNSGLIPQIQESIHSSKVSFVAYNKPYNFSDKCNEGAAHATGDILIFFNDDVRPLEKNWLEDLLEFLEIPGIGGVSPKLIYEDDTIQYAGMATGVRNLLGTTFHSLNRNSTHYLNFPQLVRDVSILSGACLAIRKDLFEEINGFDIIDAPIGHSDVDLSFKILEAGFRCVYTPYATLRHIGHLSLKTFEEQEKISQKKLKKDKADIFLLKRWGKYLNDPYFPTPLKNHVYHDSPEPYHIYVPETVANNSRDAKDILLVTHDLSFSGAPLMLFSTAKILKDLGFFIVVVSPHHGPLQKLYEEVGITVIVDELVLSQHPSFERFAKNFDFIICNTVVCWPAVKQMQNITKTIWWIHEGKVAKPYFLVPAFVETLRSARHIIGVSDYSISFFKNYNANITKIYNYFDGISAPIEKAAGEQKLIFSLIGSIESRKGQLVLINALKKIRPELLLDAEIWIIGRTLHHEYYAELVTESESMPAIKIMGEKSHRECIKLMQQSDVILNTSTDDPFPLSLVEALSMNKPCIVSSNTGLAELMTDGFNGFIFESGNAFDLSKKIQYILSNRDVLETIGKNGHETFEEHLSKEKAIKNWKSYLEQVQMEAPSQPLLKMGKNGKILK